VTWHLNRSSITLDITFIPQSADSKRAKIYKGSKLVACFGNDLNKGRDLGICEIAI